MITCTFCKGKCGFTEDQGYGYYVSIECPECDGKGKLTFWQSVRYIKIRIRYARAKWKVRIYKWLDKPFEF